MNIEPINFGAALYETLKLCTILFVSGWAFFLFISRKFNDLETRLNKIKLDVEKYEYFKECFELFWEKCIANDLYQVIGRGYAENEMLKLELKNLKEEYENMLKSNNKTKF